MGNRSLVCIRMGGMLTVPVLGWRLHGVGLVLCAVVGLGHWGKALGQSRPPPSGERATSAVADPDLGWELAVGTELPVHVGVEGGLRLPYGLLVRSQLGWMPSGYVGLINAVATRAGWYDEQTADLVSAAVDNAVAWRLSAGIQPFANLGLELLGGYSLIAARGGAARSDLLRGGAMGLREDAAINARARLHALHLTVAWTFRALDPWFVRASLGWLHTVASTATITAEGTDSGVALERAIAATERYLEEDVFERYGFSLVLGLMGGYRF